MAAIAHLRELLGRGRPREAGHNPVGGAMVVALLLAVLLQVLAGLQRRPASASPELADAS